MIATSGARGSADQEAKPEPARDHHRLGVLLQALEVGQLRAPGHQHGLLRAEAAGRGEHLVGGHAQPRSQIRRDRGARVVQDRVQRRHPGLELARAHLPSSLRGLGSAVTRFSRRGR
jgi:hypothetical protein